jgi:hypothetical protein
MPDTANFAITYPCEGPVISCNDFATLAADVEAALVTVDAEATVVTHRPQLKITADTTAAVGVDTIMTFVTFSGATSYIVNGFTVNNAAGTITIITPGLYLIGIQVAANQSTLTMTSQRMGVYVNGVLNTVRKYRGNNPADVGVLSGANDSGVALLAGDVVTVRYLWTGTGALNGIASGDIRMALLSTP